MTLKEWIEWKENCKNCLASSRSVKEHLIRREKDTFADFISSSFMWDWTPEGYDYWKKIALRTKPIEK